MKNYEILSEKLTIVDIIYAKIYYKLKEIKSYKFKLYKCLFDVVLNKLIKMNNGSGLVNHAMEEFIYAGYKPINKCKNDPDKWIQENVIELLKVFSLQGHSGFSASWAINYFTTLAKHQPLTPIQGTDNEWFLHDEIKDITLYQNKRCGAIFKNDVNNDSSYYLDALVWCDKDGVTFTGNVYLRKTNGDLLKISSRQYIKFPFIPKSFYIDVVEENEEYYIANEQQLTDALLYFKG